MRLKRHEESGEMLRLDVETAPVVEELQRLAPEVNVVGGSFKHWLRTPKNVPSAQRFDVLERARRKATRTCLTTLLESAGLCPIEPAHLSSGARDWPSGYTGSVSHKGTKVVAALTPIGHMRSIGIDIETLDGGRELSETKGLIASEELPPDLGAAGSVILFSVKEAVFKALNPVLGIRFGYEDVQTSWTQVSPQGLRGVAHFQRIAVDVRCSTVLPSWVGSVAFLLRQPELLRLSV